MIHPSCLLLPLAQSNSNGIAADATGCCQARRNVMIASVIYKAVEAQSDDRGILVWTTYASVGQKIVSCCKFLKNEILNSR